MIQRSPPVSWQRINIWNMSATENTLRAPAALQFCTTRPRSLCPKILVSKTSNDRFLLITGPCYKLNAHEFAALVWLVPHTEQAESARLTQLCTNQETKLISLKYLFFWSESTEITRPLHTLSCLLFCNSIFLEWSLKKIKKKPCQQQPTKTTSHPSHNTVFLFLLLKRN